MAPDATPQLLIEVRTTASNVTVPSVVAPAPLQTIVKGRGLEDALLCWTTAPREPGQSVLMESPGGREEKVPMGVPVASLADKGGRDIRLGWVSVE